MPRFLSPYDLDEIYGVLQDRIVPVPTELQSNFSQVIEFDTETINLDRISDDLRISIFVEPEITGPVHTPRGYETKVFYPGYVKDKTTVDFNNIRKRQVGEKLSVPTSNEGKIAAALMSQMQHMEDKRIRLKEWMAAQTLLYGNYTIVSKLHRPVNVDFEPNIATHLTNNGVSTATVPAAQAVGLNKGRANRANISGTNVTNPTTGQIIPTLGTNRAWGAASQTPVADLQAMLDAAFEQVESVYMSDDAFAKLTTDPLFSTIVTPVLSATSQFRLDLAPKQQSKAGLKIRGFIGGQNIPIWTYNASYQPTDSTATAKFIDSGWVVMVPSSNYGIQAFGAIQHGLADFRAQEVFWNSWTTEEFGKPWLQMQSAPIFLHLKINSTVAWKVM